METRLPHMTFLTGMQHLRGKWSLSTSAILFPHKARVASFTSTWTEFYGVEDRDTRCIFLIDVIPCESRTMQYNAYPYPVMWWDPECTASTCRYRCLYAAHLVLPVQGKLCRKADQSAALTVCRVPGEKSAMKRVLLGSNVHRAALARSLFSWLSKYIICVYLCTFYISPTTRISWLH